jgi:hypothetical protein
VLGTHSIFLTFFGNSKCAKAVRHFREDEWVGTLDQIKIDETNNRRVVSGNKRNDHALDHDEVILKAPKTSERGYGQQA